MKDIPAEKILERARARVSVFPEIRSPEDIRKAIEWKKKTFGEADEFVENEREGYTVFKYAVHMEHSFPDPEKFFGEERRFALLLRECRGIKFGSGGGIPAARPYHKFFNADERPETATGSGFDLDEPHIVLEKLDGSMLHPLIVEGDIRWSTKSGLSDQSVSAEKYIAASKKKYDRLAADCLYLGWTPIFEWMDASEPIVVLYAKNALILTGVRRNSDGLYLSYKDMKELAETYGVPCVGTVSVESMTAEDLKIRVAEDKSDMEGYVIRFADGRMIKMKTEKYVRRHCAKEAVRFEKNLIKAFLENTVDDTVALLSAKDRSAVEAFRSVFFEGVRATAESLTETGNSLLSRTDNRKDFAAAAMATLAEKASYLFRGYEKAAESGKFDASEIRNELLRAVEKRSSTSKRLETVRDLFGGARWSLFYAPPESEEDS